MQHKPSLAPPPREISPARLEAFSDGVLAVIITIMVLELRPPEGDSPDELKKLLPGLLIYVLSFTFIGNYWNNHHHLLRPPAASAAALCGPTSTCCSGSRWCP
jgi:uncharacterized membrane protein